MKCKVKPSTLQIFLKKFSILYIFKQHPTIKNPTFLRFYVKLNPCWELFTFLHVCIVCIIMVHLVPKLSALNFPLYLTTYFKFFILQKLILLQVPNCLYAPTYYPTWFISMYLIKGTNLILKSDIWYPSIKNNNLITETTIFVDI